MLEKELETVLVLLHSQATTSSVICALSTLGYPATFEGPYHGCECWKIRIKIGWNGLAPFYVDGLLFELGCLVHSQRGF